MVFESLYFHVTRFHSDIKDIMNKIDDKDIQSKIQRFSDWVTKQSNNIKKIKEYYEENPEEILKDFK